MRLQLLRELRSTLRLALIGVGTLTVVAAGAAFAGQDSRALTVSATVVGLVIVVAIFAADRRAGQAEARLWAERRRQELEKQERPRGFDVLPPR